ncbi:MAG: hypothetical protein N2588_09645 [Rhodovarius sp.]|nr:hypothetical protein [Rhodovarius sp.]
MRLRILALLIPLVLPLAACVEEPYAWHYGPSYHGGWHGGPAYRHVRPGWGGHWRPSYRPAWSGHGYGRPSYGPGWSGHGYGRPSYGPGWAGHGPRFAPLSHPPAGHRPHPGWAGPTLPRWQASGWHRPVQGYRALGR